MKLIICTFFVFFCLSGTQAQKGYVTRAIMELALPCAHEVGLSRESLDFIESGNLPGLRGGFGCFADCIAKKLGIVGDDNSFSLEKYNERIGKIVQPDIFGQITDACVGLAGTENCKVAGSVLHCSITKIVDVFYE